MSEDIRWQQSFSNHNKALSHLEGFLDRPELIEREQQILIKAFEYTFWLAWNILSDLFCSHGNATLLGLRPILLETYPLGLIKAGESRMLTIHDCTFTSHSSNRAAAEAIRVQILKSYLPCFQALRLALKQLLQQEAGS